AEQHHAPDGAADGHGPARGAGPRRESQRPERLRLAPLPRRAHRGDRAALPARPAPPAIQQGVRRPHRDQARPGGGAGAAAPAEDHRGVRLRPPVLRRDGGEPAREQAPSRQGALVRGREGADDRPDPDSARLRLLRFRPRHGELRHPGRRPHGHAARLRRLLHPLLQQGIAGRPQRRGPEDLGRDVRSRSATHRHVEAGLRPRRPRPQERQRGAVVQLPARHRAARHDRRQPPAHHRHARRGLGRRDLPQVPARRLAPRLYRLQLERVPNDVHARPRRHVAGRHRLRRALGGPRPLPRRRQGGLRGGAARARLQPPLRPVRRRLRHPGNLAQEGAGLAVHPVGAGQAHATPDAGRGPRRAGPRLALPQRGGDRPQPLPARLLPVAGSQLQDRPRRPAGDRAGDSVPRRDRHRAHQHHLRRRRGGRVEARDRRVPAGAGAERARKL
ncbi:MAG: ABC transporter, substrate-binding protein (cluster 1, maltose/g3p/polyamine/iron), partial [uncultured Acetobacteraceae bacterium]